ncbi:hypothetical protein, partial [uncultured Helicobacter sp.]
MGHNEKVDGNKPRKEICLVLESHSMMLCCKARYKILKVFRVVNKLSGDVKILLMLHNLFVNKKSLLT